MGSDRTPAGSGPRASHQDIQELVETRLRSGSTSWWQQATALAGRRSRVSAAPPGPAAGARPGRRQPFQCRGGPGHRRAGRASRGTSSEPRSQVGAAHRVGGAAQAALALAPGPSPGRGQEGAPRQPGHPVPHRGRERAWSRHHPIRLLGGAITEPSLSLKPPVNSVSIPLRISRKSSVSLSRSPLPLCYRNWVILLLHRRGGGWQEEATHQPQLYFPPPHGVAVEQHSCPPGAPSGPAVPGAGP